MPKQLFTVLLGLVLLIPCQFAQAGWKTANGELLIPPPAEPLPEGLCPPAMPWNTVEWGEGVFHPENGDRIVGVNQWDIYNARHLYNAVLQSPSEILIRVIDQHTGRTYYLRTHLLSRDNNDRLGIVVEDSPNGNGAIITGVWAGTPGMRCQVRGDDIYLSYFEEDE